MILFAVHTGGKLGGQGEGPGAGIVTVVTFVQFETVHAGVNQCLLMVGKNLPCLRQCKVRYQTIPNQRVGRVGGQSVMNWSSRMGKGVLPKIDMDAPCLHFGKEGSGIGEKITPGVAAGISVVLPSGFQADDVQRDILGLHLIHNTKDLLVGIAGVATVQNAQTPLWCVTAAAGEHIVLGNNVSDSIAFDDVNIHTLAAGNLNRHGLVVFLPKGIKFRSGGTGFFVRFFFMGAHCAIAAESRIHLVATIKFSIPGSIHIHTPTLVSHKEGNGGVAVAGGGNGVSIDRELQLPSAVIELLELQTKTVDLGIVFQGEGQNAATVVDSEGNILRRETDIGRMIVEVFAVFGRNMLFRCAKS